MHQLSRCGSSDVSAAPEPSSPFSSTLIPGEHVCWNSPPIKTGIRQVRCGNRVWENGGSGSLSFPHQHSASFSLALVGEATSLLPHPYCNPSSHIYSPYILFLLHILITEFCLSYFSVCRMAHLLFFSSFLFFSHPLNQPPRSTVAFGLNSPSFSEVRGSSGPPPPPRCLFSITLLACLEGSRGLLHE